MSASNIVPFATTPPAPTATPWPPGPWPMPGCAPPGAMDGLMGCYYSVQQATAFISAIMIDAINNNPAVTQAIIAAIEASGSTLPLIGVTNGTDAQHGQVGEWVLFQQTVNFTAAPQSQTITMGILQPGDWDYVIYANCPSPVKAINITVQPFPAGSAGVPQAFAIADGNAAEQVVAVAPSCRLLTSVPVLMPILVLTNQSVAGPGSGTMTLYLSARRRR